MRQGVCDVCFRAFPVVPMVFWYEVYHPWAPGLKVAVFVAYQRVYLAPCLLCFVGSWWARCPTRTFGVQSCGASSLCAMAWAALTPAVTVGGSVGSATWGSMPVSVGKFQYVVNIPGWWALWVSRRVRRSACLIWATASGCIVVG